MKNVILIIGGDPNSINSEIIYKTWIKLEKSIKKKFFLISNYTLLQKQFKKLNYSIKITKVNNINETKNVKSLKVLNLNLKFKHPFKVSKHEASNFILNSLNFGHKLALDNDVIGLVNCAIDKNLLKKNNIGVTEYLASKCNVKKNSEVMLISNSNLSISPITTHIDLKKVSKTLNKNIIVNKIKTINNWYKSYYKKKPRICILGLNPHNGELKKNSEEKKIIIPAILKLRKKGIKAFGPEPADSIFISNYKNFDIIVGMFHDQILPPFKALYKFNAINLTLGLKYPRVSPDHGTAKKLINKNKANPESLIRCLKFINKLKK